MKILTIFTLTFLFIDGAHSQEKGSVAELLKEPKPKIEYEWTLEEVKKISEAQNPDLKSALAHYEAANQRVTQAISGYLPHVGVTGNFQQTTLPSPSAGSTTQLGIELGYSSVVTNIKQVLFDFGKVLNDIKAAQTNRDSFQQQTIAVKNAINLSIQKAFFDVLATERLVEVAQQGVKKFEETHRRTSVLVKTGARPSFDLSQANVELSKAKLNFINAKNGRDLSKITLLNIMGMPKEVVFKLKDPPRTKLSHPEELTLENLTAKALLYRPELKKSELAVQSALARLHSETKNYFPTISVEGWYGKYNANYPASISDAWGGGITASWSLFDGFYTSGKVGEYEANVSAESANLEREKQAIVSEVAQSLMEVERSENNLTVANEALVFSKENARLALRRYNANVATFLEMLVADTSLLNAEAVAVQAEYVRENAIALLRKAVNYPLD